MIASDPCTHASTANGELQTETCGSEETTYTSDAFGDLVHLTMRGATPIDSGDRLSPVAEPDGSGNVVARFVSGPNPTSRTTR